MGNSRSEEGYAMKNIFGYDAPEESERLIKDTIEVHEINIPYNRDLPFGGHTEEFNNILHKRYGPKSLNENPS